MLFCVLSSLITTRIREHTHIRIYLQTLIFVAHVKLQPMLVRCISFVVCVVVLLCWCCQRVLSQSMNLLYRAAPAATTPALKPSRGSKLSIACPGTEQSPPAGHSKQEKGNPAAEPSSKAIKSGSPNDRLRLKCWIRLLSEVLSTSSLACNSRRISSGTATNPIWHSHPSPAGFV